MKIIFMVIFSVFSFYKSTVIRKRPEPCSRWSHDVNLSLTSALHVGSAQVFETHSQPAGYQSVLRNWGRAQRRTHAQDIRVLLILTIIKQILKEKNKCCISVNQTQNNVMSSGGHCFLPEDPWNGKYERHKNVKSLNKYEYNEMLHLRWNMWK